MKKLATLTLATLTLATLTACGAENTNTTNTPTPTETTTQAPAPTPVTLEPSRDAEHPKRAQGNDYSTGMLGTEEQTPGTITTTTPDTPAEE